jgi:hypothetical protein
MRTMEGVRSHAHVLKAISRLFMGRRSLLSGEVMVRRAFDTEEQAQPVRVKVARRVW